MSETCPQVLDCLAGPLAALRRQRLQAKAARRRVERGKRALLHAALREEERQQARRTRPRGLFLEFGVASGASINYISARSRLDLGCISALSRLGASINYIAARAPHGSTVHGFDSFEGRDVAERQPRCSRDGGAHFYEPSTNPPRRLVARPGHVRDTSLGLPERWRGQEGDTAAAGANEAAREAGFFNAA